MSKYIFLILSALHVQCISRSRSQAWYIKCFTHFGRHTHDTHFINLMPCSYLIDFMTYHSRITWLKLTLERLCRHFLQTHYCWHQKLLAKGYYRVKPVQQNSGLIAKSHRSCPDFPKVQAFVFFADFCFFFQHYRCATKYFPLYDSHDCNHVLLETQHILLSYKHLLHFNL